MPLVESTLASVGLALGDVDAIVAGVGPGPSPDCVGVVTATTLDLVLRRPVKGVCSLDAVAAAWSDAPERFVAVSDARRGVYWAVRRRRVEGSRS